MGRRAPEAFSLLLVEDDDDLRTVFQRRLERRGYAVAAVADPHAALEMVGGAIRPFDAAVVDRTLPPPGGTALVEELKRRHAEMPVIVMSGSLADEWVAEVKQLGASSCLVKPFALADLEAALRQVLPRSEAV